jgi:hypothetical protein
LLKKRMAWIFWKVLIIKSTEKKEISPHCSSFTETEEKKSEIYFTRQQTHSRF